LAIRDELDIPIPAMAPSYRPSARNGDVMDSGTKRLAVFAGIIGAVLLGLVAAWGFTTRHRGGVPVIEAQSGPLKVKPANPGGLQVADAGQSILNGDADGKQTLAPAPETPAPQGLKAQGQAARAAPAAAPPPPVAPAGAPQAKAAAAASPPAAEAATPEEPRVPPSKEQRVASRAPGVPEGSSATVGGASIRLIPTAKPPGPVAGNEPPPPPRPGLKSAARFAPAVVVAQATPAPAQTTAPAAEPTQPAQPMPDTTTQSAPMQSTPLPPPATQATPAAAAPPAPAAPAAAPAAAPPATKAAAATGHGKHPVVQFASLGSGPAALAEWHRLMKAYPDILGDHTPNITKFDHDGKTYWRVRTGGFGNLADAVQLCQKVRSRGGMCIATF
jgi:hypothetical protein